MKKNILNIFLFTSLSLFLLLLILLLVVDVKTTIVGSKIGLSSLNELFVNYQNNDLCKISDIISDCFMFAAIGCVLFFAGIGAYQLFKNKSLKKVDIKILTLGGFVILFAVLWVLFDKILIINYRPILVDGELEGSFPSTHVMLVTFVFLTCNQFINFDNKSKLFKCIFYVIIITIIVLTSVGRILSMMHWFTDVIGGILMGLTLYFAYLKSIEIVNNKINK